MPIRWRSFARWRSLTLSVLTVAASLATTTAPGATPAPVAGFTWPLSPQPAVVRAFDPPPAPWAAGHRGVDLAGRPGQPVLAAGAGRVAFSGVIAGRGVVAVQHSGGRRTTYEPVEDRDAVGTLEQPGDQLGTLASRGSHCAPTACLHWGLVVGADEYRDPLTLLGFRRPRLLPLG